MAHSVSERPVCYFTGPCSDLNFVADATTVGAKHSWGRFGPGIYTSSCSSSKAPFPPPFPMTIQLTVQTEADDYFKSVNSSSKVESRALLLNVVVYGNPCMLYYNDTSANSLRSGFHSVGLFSPLKLRDSAGPNGLVVCR